MHAVRGHDVDSIVIVRYRLGARDDRVGGFYSPTIANFKQLNRVAVRVKSQSPD